MDIKMNNFFVRLYRYFYNMDCYDSMPPGICKYFWGLLFACICIIPLEIIGLPYTLWKFCFKKAMDMYPCTKAGVTLLLVLAVGVLYSALIPIINIWHTQSKNDIEVGYIIDTIILIVCLVLYIANRKGPSVLGTFISAKFKGVCPRVNWIVESPTLTEFKIDYEFSKWLRDNNYAYPSYMNLTFLKDGVRYDTADLYIAFKLTNR